MYSSMTHASAPHHDAPPPDSYSTQCTLCVAALFKYAELARESTEEPKEVEEFSHLAVQDDRLKWPLFIPITISFLNGKDETKNKVMHYANAWCQEGGANVRWERSPDKDNSADIRIRFKPNGEWWSYMGTKSKYNDEFWDQRTEEAKKDNPERASMNIDIETPQKEEDIRRHVIHEFGHALGFMHEHLRSDFPYELDPVEAVKAYEKQNWSIEKIKRNVLTAVKAPHVKLYGTTADLDSIMIYPFKKGVLKGGVTIKWNTTLSVQDIKYAQEAYPGEPMRIKKTSGV